MDPVELQAWLTGALVLITGFYAVMTYRAVNETRKARQQSLMPGVRLKPVSLAPTYTVFEVVNVGPGAAVDAELSLTCVPREESEDPHVREWHSPVIAVDDSYQLSSPDHMNIDDFGEKYQLVRLAGTCWDVLGNQRVVHDEVDVQAWWDQLVGSERRREPDHVKQIADNTEALSKTLDKIHRETRSAP